jgi:hypothetical protein
LRQVQFPADDVELMPGAVVMTSIDLFTDRRVGRCKNAIVVDEVGHYEAIACAERLLKDGAAVTFITRHKLFAPGIDIALRTQSALQRLYDTGDFTLRVGARLLAVRPGSADIVPNFGRRVETFGADIVVWVPIRAGQTPLAETLAARGIATVCVGDAVAGRNLQTAIREGHLAARSLVARERTQPRPVTWEEGRKFFSEEKNQKTFAPAPAERLRP